MIDQGKRVGQVRVARALYRELGRMDCLPSIMKHRNNLSVKQATVFVPCSIGNVGPGFDVLGLAVEGLGDRVTVELRDDPKFVVELSGIDAAEIPTDPSRNTASLAAGAALNRGGWKGGARIHIEKGLRLSSGLGGSAASSVGGAAAAMLALSGVLVVDHLILDALAGESVVSGRHLDNILPATLGGLTLSRSIIPLDYSRLTVAEAWWIALVTPAMRIETKTARAILEDKVPRSIWIQQMANTAAMVHAFATGDGALLGRALDDVFAEPVRKSLIPHFDAVKKNAIEAGSIGCSISGSGPTVFAVARDASTARKCAEGMQDGFAEIDSTVHVGPIAEKGVRPA